MFFLNKHFALFHFHERIGGTQHYPTNRDYDNFEVSKPGGGNLSRENVGCALPHVQLDPPKLYQYCKIRLLVSAVNPQTQKTDTQKCCPNGVVYAYISATNFSCLCCMSLGPSCFFLCVKFLVETEIKLLVAASGKHDIDSSKVKQISIYAVVPSYSHCPPAPANHLEEETITFGRTQGPKQWTGLEHILEDKIRLPHQGGCYRNLTKSSLCHSHPLPLFQCQITTATLFRHCLLPVLPC